MYNIYVLQSSVIKDHNNHKTHGVDDSHTISNQAEIDPNASLSNVNDILPICPIILSGGMILIQNKHFKQKAKIDPEYIHNHTLFRNMINNTKSNLDTIKDYRSEDIVAILNAYNKNQKKKISISNPDTIKQQVDMTILLQDLSLCKHNPNMLSQYIEYKWENIHTTNIAKLLDIINHIKSHKDIANIFDQLEAKLQPKKRDDGRGTITQADIKAAVAQEVQKFQAELAENSNNPQALKELEKKLTQKIESNKKEGTTNHELQKQLKEIEKKQEELAQQQIDTYKKVADVEKNGGGGGNTALSVTPADKDKKEREAIQENILHYATVSVHEGQTTLQQEINNQELFKKNVIQLKNDSDTEQFNKILAPLNVINPTYRLIDNNSYQNGRKLLVVGAQGVGKSFMTKNLSIFKTHKIFIELGFNNLGTKIKFINVLLAIDELGRKMTTLYESIQQHEILFVIDEVSTKGEQNQDLIKDMKYHLANISSSDLSYYFSANPQNLPHFFKQQQNGSYKQELSETNIHGKAIDLDHEIVHTDKMILITGDDSKFYFPFIPNVNETIDPKCLYQHTTKYGIFFDYSNTKSQNHLKNISRIAKQYYGITIEINNLNTVTALSGASKLQLDNILRQMICLYLYKNEKLTDVIDMDSIIKDFQTSFTTTRASKDIILPLNKLRDLTDTLKVKEKKNTTQTLPDMMMLMIIIKLFSLGMTHTELSACQIMPDQHKVALKALFDPKKIQQEIGGNDTDTKTQRTIAQTFLTKNKDKIDIEKIKKYLTNNFGSSKS